MTESQLQCESAMMMLFHLTKLNSMIALGLYYWRNKIIRESIDSIFKRRKSGYIFCVSACLDENCLVGPERSQKPSGQLFLIFPENN